MRWIYAGGVPYTPLDVEKSKLFHRAVYNENRINEVRYPDYHSMNIRLDRRFHFNKSNIIVYLSAWNVYNRKNVVNYFWNDKEQKQDEVYQWGLLPIIGVEKDYQSRTIDETNIDLSSIFDLSPTEKLQLVEDLWDDLAAMPEKVPVYDWQKRELASRKTNLMNNPASGLYWEEVKRRIRNRYGR